MTIYELALQSAAICDVSIACPKVRLRFHLTFQIHWPTAPVTEGVPLSPPAHLLTSPEIFYLSSLFIFLFRTYSHIHFTSFLLYINSMCSLFYSFGFPNGPMAGKRLPGGSTQWKKTTWQHAAARSEFGNRSRKRRFGREEVYSSANRRRCVRGKVASVEPQWTLGR